jgi:hypothetical protein
MGEVCQSGKMNPISRIFDKDESARRPDILHEIFNVFNLLVPQFIKASNETFLFSASYCVT